MKNLIKSLCVVGLLMLANQSYGATVSIVAASAATTNSILTAGSRVTQVVIANAGSNATTFALLDAPSTAITYVVGAYTNYTTVATGSTTNVYVTPSGVSQTNITAVGVIQTVNNVAATTNTYPAGFVYTIPASSTVTFTPAGNGMLFMRGTLLTNSAPGGNLTLTLTYFNQQ